MNKLLFPTDFSEVSHNALQYTQNFVQALSAEITLMHAYDPGRLLSRWLTARRQRNVVWDQMVEFTNNEDGKVPANISFMIRRGKLEERIVQSCKKRKPRFIALGKKHSYSTFHRVLGSKTSKIISQVNCPVLVIPNGAEFSGIRNILIIDGEYRNLEKPVQEMILSLSLSFKANLHYIDVNQHTMDWSFNREQLSKNSFLYQKSMPEDYAVEGIFEYIQDNKIDMMVMRTTRRSLFEKLFDYSYQHNCLEQTDVPLLVFNSNFIKSSENAAETFVPLHSEAPEQVAESA